MPNSLDCAARMPALSTVISTVPPCRADTVCRSPPSVPPGKSLTAMRPPVLAATRSANFCAPWACGWSFWFWKANLMVRSWACAADSSDAATRAVASRVLSSFMEMSPWVFRRGRNGAERRGPGRRWGSTTQPAQRHHDDGGEQHQQEHHGQLGQHEGRDAACDLRHGHAPHPSHHVEHRAHRWGDEPDGVVDDEEHAEVHRV